MEHLLRDLYSNAVHPPAETLLLQLLYPLVAILLATQAVVWIGKRFLGQTEVSGEILSGLLLGPSCLGLLFPVQMKALFNGPASPALTALAELGLIFLMFEIGLTFEFGQTFAESKRTILATSVLGIVVPFGLGIATAGLFWQGMSEPRPSRIGFELFFATAMSITAIPVLGRIFSELRLTRSRVAGIVMSAAAIDDVCGWILLGIVAGVVQSGFSPLALAARLLAFLLYVFGVFALSRLLGRWLAAATAARNGISDRTIGWTTIGLLVSAAVTSNLGVFAIIGAFTLGVALHQQDGFGQAWTAKVSPLVKTLMLPVFFTYTGLRTDIGGLSGLEMWITCGLVLAVAFTGKFGGAYLAARSCGESHSDSVTIGVAMNTRGLMELVALNAGYDLGVLPRNMFTMLVIMAVTSTFITTPLIRRLMGGQPRAASIPLHRAFRVRVSSGLEGPAG